MDQHTRAAKRNRELLGLTGILSIEFIILI